MAKSAHLKRSTATIWLTLMLGLATTAFGVTYSLAAMPNQPPGSSLSNTIVAATIGALGAGVVGAALSIAITHASDRAGREDLLTQLSRTVGARFSSDEAMVRDLRTDWHHYHVTVVEGRAVWRYMFLRFSRLPGVGMLQARTTANDGHGHELNYLAEAGVRGSQLVLLFTTENGVGDECTEVFPQVLTHGYRSRHCGLGVFQTWEGGDMVGRAVISLSPIGDRPTPDGTVPADTAAKLDQIWNREFPARTAMTPPAQVGDTVTPGP